MHIKGVCEVIAYASCLRAWRGLGDPPSDGLDSSLRLFPWLALQALHQQHHELKFCLWWWLGNSGCHHSELRCRDGLFLPRSSSIHGRQSLARSKQWKRSLIGRAATSASLMVRVA